MFEAGGEEKGLAAVFGSAEDPAECLSHPAEPGQGVREGKAVLAPLLMPGFEQLPPRFRFGPLKYLLT